MILGLMLISFYLGCTPSVSEHHSLLEPIAHIEYDNSHLLSPILRKGYDVVLVPAGSFYMGCTSEQERDCYDDEIPPRHVTISHDLYVMRSEVTQALYQQVMGRNPSRFQTCGTLCPVEGVSWYNAVRFANRLSRRDGLTSCYRIGEHQEPEVEWRDKKCKGWRLLTEAEWEYAARGNQAYKYAGSNNLNEVGWYAANSQAKTHQICLKRINGYGLCDMSGNVWEWVWDSWDVSANRRGKATDPTFDRVGPDRVGRGGGWDFGARNARVSLRDWYFAASGFQGFRLARIAE